MARMHEIVEFVKKSRNRLDVLKTLGNGMLSTNNIASKTHLNVRTVRAVINDLRKKKLVRKATRKKTRPMIYEMTSLGTAVLKMKDASGRMKWKGTSRQKSISRTVKEKLHKI